MKFISWVIIIVGFLFAGMVNTTSFRGKFWDETSEQNYFLAETKFDYIVDYEITDIEKVFDINSYEKNSVIKVVNNDKTYYYVAYQAQFLDMTKWEDPIFWSQVIVNTIYVSALYAITLINKQENIINELGNPILNEKDEVIGNQPNPIEQEYNNLFDNEKKILPKRVDFERYLTLIVNEEETVTLYIEKLKLRRKRAYKWRVLLFILTFGIFRAKKYVKSTNQTIEQFKEYKLSLYDFKKAVKLHMDIPIKRKEITYDAVFDRTDISTNQSVRIGFSRQAETKKRIMKSPLTSFISIFTAIIFFGNIAVSFGDWLSIVVIMLTLVFASGMKIWSALKHGKDIMVTLKKSLEKTNQMILTFLELTPDQLRALKVMAEKPLALPLPQVQKVEPKKVQPQEQEQENEETTHDLKTTFEYGYE